WRVRKKKDDEQVSRLIVKNYRLNQLYEQYKNERDTLIDDVAILKANNDRLIRRNQKLEAYVRMWEKLTKWKQGKLAEHCNNDLLHELSYTMNE
ncbi:hypothetical protein, partial [Lacticaseibacillus rhamnosus]|uniref:hypothetical protein n=1 Tax=Lacticaseibacillus rhamnosus TaxID=47715 RepID=UPI003F4758C5